MEQRAHAIDPRNRRGAEAEARLRRILAVAERMFIERGYAHTSLDAIVRRSGGSGPRMDRRPLLSDSNPAPDRHGFRSLLRAFSLKRLRA